ncbi:hypothetical protein CHS0354_004075 [Potamilus streckersoni]|uniref:Uncharacterized protein n=1 Tax=Potamilus streckersoni TaxID=2493646 RepID=A0AAE0W8M3_9BIVA|nr:hypothetical protein CHS0354_004075 [Potamilus streckersoni]
MLNPSQEKYKTLINFYEDLHNRDYIRLHAIIVAKLILLNLHSAITRLWAEIKHNMMVGVSSPCKGSSQSIDLRKLVDEGKIVRTNFEKILDKHIRNRQVWQRSNPIVDKGRVIIGISLKYSKSKNVRELAARHKLLAASKQDVNVDIEVGNEIIEIQDHLPEEKFTYLAEHEGRIIYRTRRPQPRHL